MTNCSGATARLTNLKLTDEAQVCENYFQNGNEGILKIDLKMIFAVCILNQVVSGRYHPRTRHRFDMQHGRAWRGIKTSGQQGRREDNMRNLDVNKRILKRVLNSVVGSMNVGINLQIQIPDQLLNLVSAPFSKRYKTKFVTM